MPLLDGTGLAAFEAAVLVVKGGVGLLLGDGQPVLAELRTMQKDSTSLSYSRVVNKYARDSNCVGDFDQAPDIRSPPVAAPSSTSRTTRTPPGCARSSLA
eukprot:7033362-Prymnesium_polylepis.2